MKLIPFLAAAFLLMLSLQAKAEEQLPSCIPLNETISICTDIDGLDVAFVGATETSAMGIVDLRATEGISYGWWVFWANDSVLDKIASEQKRDLEDYYQYEFEAPASVVVEGFPGVRYDLLPGSDGDRELLPKSLLFLDTGGGITMLYGEASRPDVSAEDLFFGAKTAARILKKAE